MSAAALLQGFEFLDRYSHIVYPVLAVLVIVLLAAGIAQAWKAQDLDGLAKAKFKRELIYQLRQQTGGVTAEALARAVKLEPFKVVRLLEELQQDGMVSSHTNTHRLTVWQARDMRPGK